MSTYREIRAWEDQNLPSGTHVSWPTASRSHLWPPSPTWDRLVQLPDRALGIHPGGGPEAGRQGLTPPRSPAQARPAPVHCSMASQNLRERVSRHLRFPSRGMLPPDNRGWGRNDVCTIYPWSSPGLRDQGGDLEPRGVGVQSGRGQGPPLIPLRLEGSVPWTLTPWHSASRQAREGTAEARSPCI